MQLLLSDLRNTTVLAISSGVPSLPSGTMVEIAAIRCWPASEEATSLLSRSVHWLLRYPASIDNQRSPDGELCVVRAEIEDRCGDLLGNA